MLSGHPITLLHFAQTVINHMTKYPNRNTTTMKTIKINNNLIKIKINYDGTVIYVNGRLAKATLYGKQKKGLCTARLED